jgi:PBSX family phage terminase large subunit
VTITAEHVYTPRGVLRDLFSCRANEILVAGPAGTGKSMACLQKIHLAALVNPGMRALIVRKTLASLGSTALVTWKNRVIGEALETGAVKFYGGSPQESPQYKYSNGSVIVVGGMDRSIRIMSSEYDVIYVQEATELTEDDWEALTTRLRNGKMSFQQLIADCNPAQPTHWLKARCDRGSTTMLESRHEDNPTLFTEHGKLTDVGVSYIGKLDALTGVRYLRLRKGLWAAADGLVYDEYDPNTHLVNGPKISSGKVTWPPEDWTRYWTVDFGYIHPMVVQFWAEDPDGKLYLYREIYRQRKTVDEVAKMAIDAVTFKDYKYVGPLEFAYQGRRWKEPRPRAVICDHDAENRAVFEREIGISTIPAKKTVADGIQAVKQRLRDKRLFICRDALLERDPELAESHRPTCSADEVLGYAWDTAGGKKLKDAPVKVEDDGMDAMRYVVAHLDLKARTRIRWM